VPEEGHGGAEIVGGGEHGVPGAAEWGGVESEVGSQEAVDCGCFWEGPGERFGDCVGSAEGVEGNC
jgi:hypothetical protein